VRAVESGGKTEVAIFAGDAATANVASVKDAATPQRANFLFFLMSEKAIDGIASGVVSEIRVPLAI
jgi:hypothetical protein